MKRRTFLSRSFATAAGITILPSGIVSGQNRIPPSERLNIALIGAGGRGIANYKQIFTHCPGVQVAALCDVDMADTHTGRARWAMQQFPDAKRYRDYRVMFEKRQDYDAVVISTPDHSHALPTLMAMDLKKHVYCEKPLTRTAEETHQVLQAARKSGVITQMGNQRHSYESMRMLCEWIWDGAIGDVRDVHIWSNRPTGSRYLFPCGTERPKETPPVPASLNWDLWLGPAPYRPYHRNYHPTGWRAYYDFGCGALGDMGCHQIDAPFWALKLNEVSSYEVEASKTYHSKEASLETFPVAAIVRYCIPPRTGMPAVTINWYDGGMMPPIPKEFVSGRRLADSGTFIMGDKGVIYIPGFEGADGFQLLPLSKHKAYQRPPKTLPRSQGHHLDWINGCRRGVQPSANFEYSAPLTELVQLGCLAIRLATPLPRQLVWDRRARRITNDADANDYLHYEYRDGWSV